MISDSSKKISALNGPVYPRIICVVFVFILLLVQSNVSAYAQDNDEGKRKCLSDSKYMYLSSKELFDKSTASDDLEMQTWKGRYDKLTSSRNQRAEGKYGDVELFDHTIEPATAIVDQRVHEIETAIHFNEENGRALIEKEARNPNDLSVFCQKVMNDAAGAALHNMEAAEAKHEVLIATIESCYRLRVRYSSTVSKAYFLQQVEEIAPYLRELTKKENQTSEDEARMVNVLLHPE